MLDRELFEGETFKGNAQYQAADGGGRVSLV